MDVYLKYRLCVMNYFFAEWSESSINLKKLKRKTEVDKLIYECFKSKTNVPNTAKEVDIFLSTLYEQL